MSNWFRFYDEALDDPKVQKLPAEDFRSWVNLLCLAARNDGRLPPIEDIAFALRMDNNGAITLVERLTNGGLIDRCNGGANGWYNAPHGWKKRQYKSDTSTERVKRFRERSATAPVTPPESETETEEIGGKPPIIARRAADPFPKPDFADDQHWRDFLLNRKRKRLPNTATAHAKLLRDIARISTDEWPPGRLIEHAAAKGWGGIYDPNGDTQNGTRQLATQPRGGNLRGSRPDPALDMLNASRAAGSAGDWGDRGEAGVTLPALWPG